MMYRIISFVLLLSFKHATRFNVIRLFSKYLCEIFPYITKTTLHLRNRIGRGLGDPFRERDARRNAKDGLQIILSSMICRAVCSPSLHLSNSESCKTLPKKFIECIYWHFQPPRYKRFAFSIFKEIINCSVYTTLRCSIFPWDAYAVTRPFFFIADVNRQILEMLGMFDIFRISQQ